jgi:hypothetical protein
MFPQYHMDPLTSLLYGVSCEWIDEVGRALLDYDSYFEICNVQSTSITAPTTGYLTRLPNYTFRVRLGQEYRFMSLPSDGLCGASPFRFKDLPLEVRETVLRHLLVCHNAILDIDVTHNLCLTGFRRLPLIIKVAAIGNDGPPMQLNLPKKLAILRTDKKTSAKARHIFFHENRFAFRSCLNLSDISRFIKRFGVERAAEVSSLTITIEQRKFLDKLLNILRPSFKYLKHFSVILDGNGFLEVDEYNIRRHNADGSPSKEITRARQTIVWDDATASTIRSLVESSSALGLGSS